MQDEGGHGAPARAAGVNAPVPDLTYVPGPGVEMAVERRGGRVQAVHHGHAVVLGADGAIRASWGDAGTWTFGRSATKPLQAVPFVRSGALERFGLGHRDVALACGSHDAEPFHVATAAHMLAAAGLGVGDLRCGVHDPGATAGPMPPGGWTALHNNCSGKHAAMLAACRAHQWDVATYLEPGHPLQLEVRAVMAEAAGLREVPFAVDGCGLPTFYLPLAGLARSFSWLQQSRGAGHVILDAMGAHPEMVGGTSNADTALARVTAGRVVSKYGALGVVAAVHRPSGGSLALKVSAGNAQPARAAALRIMELQGWVSSQESARLAEHMRPVLRNHAGRDVGRLEPTLG